MDYDTDAGAGGGRRLGVVMLSTDETLEYEARQALAGQAVNLLHSRVPAGPHVTQDQLRTTEAALPTAAGLLPQGLAAVAYACTSAATVIGPEAVARLLTAVHPQARASDPLSAVIAALRALGARRIGLVSPYVPEITAPLRGWLAAAGIEAVEEVSFGQKDDWTVARITEPSTRAALLAAGGVAGCDAVFASCTNLRTFGVIAEVEARLGLPVVSSNQALLWHLLALSGGVPPGAGPGRLFTLSSEEAT